MLPLESCGRYYSLLYVTIGVMLTFSQTTVCYRQGHVTGIMDYCMLLTEYYRCHRWLYATVRVMFPVSQTTVCYRQSHATVRVMLLLESCYRWSRVTVRIMSPLSRTTICQRQSHLAVIIAYCMLPLGSCYRYHILLYVTVVRLLHATVEVMLPLLYTTVCYRQSHVTVITGYCMLPLE